MNAPSFIRKQNSIDVWRKMSGIDLTNIYAFEENYIGYASSMNVPILFMRVQHPGLHISYLFIRPVSYTHLTLPTILRV